MLALWCFLLAPAVPAPTATRAAPKADPGNASRAKALHPSTSLQTLPRAVRRCGTYRPTRRYRYRPRWEWQDERVSLPEIWIGRHGETEWTKSGQHTGTTDLPLTENGRDQARRLGKRFEGVEFDLVLSSPLGRAQETARLCGLDPQPEERLREWDYGEYEGLTTKEIRVGKPGWELWTDGCPGGESLDDVVARLEPLIAELRAREDQRIALFGHGHLSRAFTACWIQLGGFAGQALKLGTASLSVMGVEHGNPVLILWNLMD
ncbi:MAG: histidine phosphatase family protein [Solirubrobacterales bacterium]|nr:histidine phosphatase family protein [Solirubrobacterales bacterium]